MHFCEELAKEDQILLQPFKHVRQKGPDRNHYFVRIYVAARSWMNCSEDIMRKLASITLGFADFIILVDDIHDDAALRRGLPPAHLIYGISRTVTSALYAANIAIEKLLKLGKPEATEHVIITCINFFASVAIETCFRDRGVCPTEEEYFEIATGRAGYLFLGSLNALKVFSPSEKNFDKFSITVGHIFAVANDYSSFKCPKFADVKSFCDDLTSGIFSFPIIHAIRSHPEDSRILDILKERTSDLKKKMQVVKLMEKFGTFEHTKKILKRLKEKLLEETEKLGGNPAIVAIAEDLVKNLDKEAFFDAIVTDA